MSRVQDARRYLARTVVRDALVAYRHRGLRPDDVFLASYPRAGSNWVKFLLLESITGRDLTFPESDEMMPYVGDHHSAPNVLPDGGRLLKTHEWYRQQYGRSIYLVRDPRDVVLSEYKYLAGRGKYTRGFDRFVEEFVGGTATGLGFWGDHVLSWLEADPAARFERLLAATFGRDAHLEYERMRRFYACEITEHGLLPVPHDEPEDAEPLPVSMGAAA